MTGATVGTGQNQESVSYTYDPLGRMTARTQARRRAPRHEGNRRRARSYCGRSRQLPVLLHPDGQSALGMADTTEAPFPSGRNLHGDVAFSMDSSGPLAPLPSTAPTERSGERRVLLLSPGVPGRRERPGDRSGGHGYKGL